jgi:exonuclease SbcC
LNTERGSATEGLAQAQRERATLEADIARVEGLIGALDEARAELATLQELERMLQQFRETIKEAGPNILKAVLHAISTEANRIFGEILGDRSSALSWEQDYEIVLRRDGRERSFAQLSGGEQMSAALAVRLALLRGLSRVDMAFFDEPTQNMDGERRGNLAEQIRRVRGFEQLVVISHDDTFEQGLDSVLHLDKRNGETVLLEDDAFALA